MKKIVIRLCLIIILFFTISIFVRFITKHVLIEKLHLNNWLTRAVFFDRIDVFFTLNSTRNRTINWKELYPFPTTVTSHQNNVASPLKDILYLTKKFKNRIISLEQKIENYTGDYLMGRMRLIELAMKYEMVIGWNLNESVIDLGNGWLTESITEADIKPFATSVSELNGYLKRLQIDFLYVQCPYVICKYDDIESDFSNENVDSFLYMLSISNIPYLDLREYIHKENLNHHDLFYKTESHWKIETGLWAAKIVGKHLKTYNVFDFDEGMFNPKLYQSDVYESWLLGNWGRKVTLVRTQPEDFTLIYPTFQTNFLLQIPTRNIDKRGTFDVFYDYDRIKTKDYYHLSPYGAFCYERNPLVIINNELTNNGKKVLCIVDSYGRIVVPFLAHGIESAEMIDLRSFDGSLKSYIEQSDPDVVLVLYNPTVFNKYENYDNLFDFR